LHTEGIWLIQARVHDEFRETRGRAEILRFTQDGNEYKNVICSLRCAGMFDAQGNLGVCRKTVSPHYTLNRKSMMSPSFTT
jgi:hypothetical protein